MELAEALHRTRGNDLRISRAELRGIGNGKRSQDWMEFLKWFRWEPCTDWQREPFFV